MGASRRSRAHLSFSRGELGCARGISAHQALPWHGVTVGLGVQQGCPWTRVLGHIPFSKEEKSNSAQDVDERIRWKVFSTCTLLVLS